MNLLLVDDEILALEALHTVVQKVIPNGTITAFNKSTQAVRFAEENKIDIAFLDIDMRIMNGLELAKELQRINPRTNIVFVTGFSEYALDAFDLYASAYLTKPVTTDAVRTAVNRLRYPIEEKRVSFHCFGNFEVYCDNRPIIFSLSRTKELLAYLVDRDGTECRKNEIIAAMFEDEVHDEYYKKLRQDLVRTFDKLGLQDVIVVSYGGLAIKKESVKCDYYDYLEGDKTIAPTEYMMQYSWAEETCARLINR